jgi:hypothetical protein
LSVGKPYNPIEEFVISLSLGVKVLRISRRDTIFVANL